MAYPDINRWIPLSFTAGFTAGDAVASFRKRAGRWVADVCVGRVRRSKRFATKAEAQNWVLRIEAELSGGQRPTASLAECCSRYLREVAPSHRGYRWEKIRLAALMADVSLASVSVAELDTTRLAAWRDARLAQVSAATVLRELNLLRSVLESARRDWGLIASNPVADLRKPKAPPPRRRRISAEAIDAMVSALGYVRGGVPVLLSQQVAVAFLLALETAMRSGEMLGLRWDAVGAKRVTLPRTKNGDRREVPLSTEARALLALMPRDGERVFSVSAGTRDALWRKKRRIAAVACPECADLHFHDARAEAIWRLSKKLDVLELSRVVGHRDPRSLMLYYNADADSLADKLG